MSDESPSTEQPAASAAEAVPQSPPARKRRPWWFRFAAIGVGLFLSAILFEITCVIIVHAGWVGARVPTYSFVPTSKTFWSDIDPDFGVWHYPNIEFRHTKACFDLIYHSNSYGARDVERAKKHAGPRVVVLGDSFMEGYGVVDEERMSNVLERETGVPHLNFGTSGSAGPTHSYALYRALASQFDHTGVIAAILPENDFDDDLPTEGRYEPYWAGTAPNYRLKYTLTELRDSEWSPETDLESFTFKRFLHDFTYTQNVVDLLYTAYKSHRTQQRHAGNVAVEESRFFEFTEAEFARMRHSYAEIAKLAAPRPLVLFTIPRAADLVAFEREQRSPLDERLAAWAATVDNVVFVPLMPEMRRSYTGRYHELFLLCDAHWNDVGHALAASIVRAGAGDRLYPR